MGCCFKEAAVANWRPPSAAPPLNSLVFFSKSYSMSCCVYRMKRELFAVVVVAALPSVAARLLPLFCWF